MRPWWFRYVWPTCLWKAFPSYFHLISYQTVKIKFWNESMNQSCSDLLPTLWTPNMVIVWSRAPIRMRETSRCLSARDMHRFPCLQLVINVRTNFFFAFFFAHLFRYPKPVILVSNIKGLTKSKLSPMHLKIYQFQHFDRKMLIIRIILGKRLVFIIKYD